MSFSFKFNQQDINDIENKVKEAFNRVINNNRMLDEVGQLLVTDIVEQTRNEKSIPLGTELKLLREKWIIYKKFLGPYNNPDPAYEEGKSNLTFTGQLLNSFTWMIKGAGKLELYFKGMHKPYKTHSKGLSGSKPLENQKLAEYVRKAGRPFVGVRPVIRRRVQRIVKDYVKRALVVARLSKNNIDS